MSSALRRPQAPADARLCGGTVFDIQPEMSSSKAVRVLLELTDVVGFEPSKDVIKKGGYHGKDEFVRELSKRIVEEVTKRHAAPTSTPTERKETNIHAQL